MYNFPVTVEFEDVDSYGIAHHTKIIAYLERARVHFFEDNKLDINSISYGLVLTNMNIQFKRPLLMMDRINVELQVNKIDRIRFEWNYTIKKDDKVAVKASIEQVIIDVSSKKIIAIPDEIKRLLESILIK